MSQPNNSVTQLQTDSVASSPESVASSALSRDQIFDLLSNQRRRSVLHFLKQQNADKTGLRELASQVAAWENGKPAGQLAGQERKRVYASLQQFHLPKLHKSGVIEYDSRRGVIELTAAADNLDVYLDVVGGQDIPWSMYYAGLSGLSVVLVAAVWSGIYPLTILPDLAWGVFMATVFTVSALAHAYHDRRMRLGVDGPPPDLRKL
jgi:hypothetical protein